MEIHPLQFYKRPQNEYPSLTLQKHFKQALSDTCPCPGDVFMDSMHVFSYLQMALGDFSHMYAHMHTHSDIHDLLLWIRVS